MALQLCHASIIRFGLTGNGSRKHFASALSFSWKTRTIRNEPLKNDRIIKACSCFLEKNVSAFIKKGNWNLNHFLEKQGE